MTPTPAFDYYGELEVSRSATLQEITTSYRRLARIHHPDKNPGTSSIATEKFQRLQQAYSTLSNQAGRKRYDAVPACTCGRCFRDEYDDDDWYSDYEDDDDGYYNDFAYCAGPGRTYSSGYSSRGFRFTSRFRTYEDMEQYFQEQERREAERLAELQEERRKREAAETARKEAKEAAKKAEELARHEEKDKRRDEERRAQEARWVKAEAVSKEEYSMACLHSDFCSKVPQKKKFKCSACAKKGGMTAFECPYCSNFLCQACVTKFSERRAKGEEIKVKPQPISEPEIEQELPQPELDDDLHDDVEELKPELNRFGSSSPTTNLCSQEPITTGKLKTGLKEVEEMYGISDGQFKKSKKKKKAAREDLTLSLQPELPHATVTHISESKQTVNGSSCPKDGKKPSTTRDGRNGSVHLQTTALDTNFDTKKKQAAITTATTATPPAPTSTPRTEPRIRVRTDDNVKFSKGADPAPYQSTGIPGLHPFPPPVQEPSLVDDDSENETPLNTDFETPSSPTSSSYSYRDPMQSQMNDGRTCYICQQPGHLARHCAATLSCQKCGSLGHLARHCAKTRKENQWQSAPRTAPAYNPKSYEHSYYIKPLPTVPKQAGSSTRVCIKGATLARGITEPLLKAAMENFGPVTEVKVDRHAGVAWADFIEHDALRNAIAASPVPVAKGAVRISEWTYKIY